MDTILNVDTLGQQVKNIYYGMFHVKNSLMSSK